MLDFVYQPWFLLAFSVAGFFFFLALSRKPN